MTYTILELSPEDTLVAIPNPIKLPLVLDILKPYYTPRILIGATSYLVAENLQESKVFHRAVLASEEYGRVSLESEVHLHFPVSDEIAHLVKLRVAKARASRIQDCIVNVLRGSRSMRSIGSKSIYTSSSWSGAVGTWRTFNGATACGWGDSERFTSDNSYLGELTFILAQELEQPARWVRIPEDDRILLEHNFPTSSERTNVTIETANAKDLGLTEAMITTQFISDY